MGWRQQARKAILRAKTEGVAKGLSGSALQSFLCGCYLYDHPVSPRERWLFKVWLQEVRVQMRHTDDDRPGKTQAHHTNVEEANEYYFKTTLQGWLFKDDRMDKPTFMRIAREMRALQKQWFATRPENRPPDLIGKAKEAERRFDRALEEFATDQRGLFDREEQD